jgi:hypothetical protein
MGVILALITNNQETITEQISKSQIQKIAAIVWIFSMRAW